MNGSKISASQPWIESLRNDDGYGNEKGKIVIGFD